MGEHTAAVKESSIRLSVDVPARLKIRLDVLAAKQRRQKKDIVREMLELHLPKLEADTKD